MRRNNEEQFRVDFTEQYGDGYLHGKKWIRHDELKVQIDNGLIVDGQHVLIEVDAGTSTKPVLGQYFLLNALICPELRSQSLFLVVNFNSNTHTVQRMRRDLCFIQSVLTQPTMDFTAFAHEEFRALCEFCDDVTSLVAALVQCGRELRQEQ